MMAPSSNILLLRRTACNAALSSRRQSSRRACQPVLSAVHDVHQHQHQQQKRRTLSTTSTQPLYAQPNKYVTGITSEQVAQSQVLKDWYAANFQDWQDEPDKIIIGEEKEEEVVDEEVEENPSMIKLPDHLTKRNIRPLVAYLRTPGVEEGSRNCDRLRNPRVTQPQFPLIPGIIHGSDPTNGILSVDESSKIMVKTPWFEIQRELDRYHYGRNGSFENRVYALTVFPSEEAHLDNHRTRNPKDRTVYKVDDEKLELIAIPSPPLPTPPPRTAIKGMENILVIPSDLQMHPVQHTTYCLNFIRYHPNKPIKIPIRLINEEESPAIKRGGFLSMVHRFIECLVDDNAPIPEYIDLECTGLRQKDVVRRERMIIPEGVTIHPRVPDDFLVGTVFGSRGSGASMGGEEGEGEEGEGGEENK